MDERRATDYPVVRGRLIWMLSVATIIILGIVGYAVYLVRAYIPIVGYVWLISTGFVPGIGIVFLIVCLVKYILQVEVVELGPTGNLIRWFHRIKEYHPLGVKEYRTRIREEKEKFQVPLLLDILKQGVLGTGDLLLGYHLEGDARWGMWDDLRTFVVAGKSRSGKTVTMTFFIIQALLGGAIVYVCDPHHHKPTGLLKVLQPIIPYLRVARSYEEIVAATAEFRGHMNARREGHDTDLIPMLIVYDEWSELLRELDAESNELVVNTVLSCAEAYAGFNGYALVGGHEWTARESGGKKGGAVRRGFHAAFVHRLDDEYARFLLKGAAGKKAAVKAPTTPKGQAYFQDSEGELDYLLIPFYGKEKEAVYEVAAILAGQLPAPDQLQAIQPAEQFTRIQRITAPLSLPEKSSGETVKEVKQPLEQSESFTNRTFAGESFTTTIEDPADALYSPEKEKAIILAAFEILQDGQKVTREAIKNRLGWSNKQHPIVKAVCDKHRIAMI